HTSVGEQFAEQVTRGHAPSTMHRHARGLKSLEQASVEQRARTLFLTGRVAPGARRSLYERHRPHLTHDYACNRPSSNHSRSRPPEERPGRATAREARSADGAARLAAPRVPLYLSTLPSAARRALRRRA